MSLELGGPDPRILFADGTPLGTSPFGPLFKATVSAPQAIPNTVSTKVNLPVMVDDTDNVYNTALSRFQPNRAGYYTFQGGVGFNSLPVSGVNYCTLAKNGVAFKTGPNPGTPSNQNYAYSVSGTVYLNGTTDYVELFVVQTSSVSVATVNNPNLTYFEGYFVRPLS